MRLGTSEIVSLLSLFTACSAKVPLPAQEPQVDAPRKPPPAENLTIDDSPTQSTVSIADDIRKVCGIADSEARFAYDSSRVLERDRAILKKLADCFATGPLKGREMRLVGHADPRGDDEYNYLLGQRRADNVRATIVDSGMSIESISTTSRGENEATGTDEIGWAKDRRVDVLLGN